MAIKKLPDFGERIENGAIQFGEDWPGLYLRGDTASDLAMNICIVLQGAFHGGMADVISMEVLAGLVKMIANDICINDESRALLLKTLLPEEFRKDS